MQVHYDEGVAIYIDPEPCVGVREDGDEASVGEGIGQPLSRDRKLFLGADAVCVAEGNMSKSANASAWATRRGRRTWQCAGFEVKSCNRNEAAALSCNWMMRVNSSVVTAHSYPAFGSD